MSSFFNKKSLCLILGLIAGILSASNLLALEQREEGGRWRASLNYKMGDQLINAQQFHERLSKWEEAIFKKFNEDNKYKGFLPKSSKPPSKRNIAVGAVTLIFKNKDEYKRFVYLLGKKNNQDNSIAFISGDKAAASSEDPYQLNFGEIPIQQKFTYLTKSSASMNITDDKFIQNMNKLINQSLKQKGGSPLSLPAPIKVFKDFPGSYLNNDNLFKLFHSEQWLLQWLEKEEGSNFATWIEDIIKEEAKEGGALEGVLKEGVLTHGWRLENIILHIHSTRDPCKNCAVSLGIIAGVEDLNFKKALRKVILKLNRNESDHLNFNLFVSSRMAFPRELVKRRRKIAGHDGKLQEGPILLNNITPFYLQTTTGGEPPKLNTGYALLEEVSSFKKKQEEAANRQAQQLGQQQVQQQVPSNQKPTQKQPADIASLQQSQNQNQFQTQQIKQKPKPESSHSEMEEESDQPQRDPSKRYKEEAKKASSSKDSIEAGIESLRKDKQPKNQQETLERKKQFHREVTQQKESQPLPQKPSERRHFQQRQQELSSSEGSLSSEELREAQILREKIRKEKEESKKKRNQDLKQAQRLSSNKKSEQSSESSYGETTKKKVKNQQISVNIDGYIEIQRTDFLHYLEGNDELYARDVLGQYTKLAKEDRDSPQKRTFIKNNYGALYIKEK